MLIEFSVGNYRSFKDVVTLSMEAAPIKSKGQLDTDNTFVVGSLRLLKSAAVYGANASGKSNLINAVKFMRQLVRHAPQQSIDEIDVEPFLLNTESAQNPSFFEVIFQLGETQYRYGFEVDRKRVHREWLYHKLKREVQLFERHDNQYKLSKKFSEGVGLEERTLANRLFLSVVDQFNGQIARQIMLWFSNLRLINANIDEPYKIYTFQQLLENKGLAPQIKQFLSKVVGEIEDWQVYSEQWREEWVPKEMPTRLRKLLLDSESHRAIVQTIHPLYDHENKRVGITEFDLDKHESAGTQKIFALTGPLLQTLYEGTILVVDELDARLHPLLTQQLVQLFNSNQTNPNHAQLIFATHDTNLLKNLVLRRDQIWFTEKNRFEATNLFSLVEYKVRNDASFEANYLEGRYGAIPYLGNIAEPLEEALHGQTR